MQLDAPSQFCVHPPPLQLKSHDAVESHVWLQPLPEQLKLHVEPALHVCWQ